MTNEDFGSSIIIDQKQYKINTNEEESKAQTLGKRPPNALEVERNQTGKRG